MIDKNKIAKAARQISEYVVDAKGFDDSKPTHLAFLDGHVDGFNAGAKWAINELMKNLWHPNTEEPREFAEVLAEAKITESIKTYISFKRNDALFKNWDAYSSGANITRWLYIDDLLPKEGGEQ
nr:MAG TPA: hypothetical protein [Caudoviricetes sp.]